MRRIKIDTGHMVNIIDVPDEPRPKPIILRIELIDPITREILSTGFRVIEVRDDHLVIN